MDSDLVRYDNSDAKRLRRAVRVCEDYSYRKQLSVLLVRVSATDCVRLRSRLHEPIDLNADRGGFVPITDVGPRRAGATGRPTDARGLSSRTGRPVP